MSRIHHDRTRPPRRKRHAQEQSRQHLSALLLQRTLTRHHVLWDLPETGGVLTFWSEDQHTPIHEEDRVDPATVLLPIRWFYAGGVLTCTAEEELFNLGSTDLSTAQRYVNQGNASHAWPTAALTDDGLVRTIIRVPLPDGVTAQVLAGLVYRTGRATSQYFASLRTE